MAEVEIFVPGRLCLFGEHSDWAGGHRRQNSEIERGYAIIVPTDQGNYIRAKPIKEPRLVFKSSQLGQSLDLALKESELIDLAKSGGPFSYVAGVAHEILVNYNGHPGGVIINGYTHGIEIDNYKTDLPIKKGLSSSASICVATAKAFKEVYDLPLSTRGIMNLAYLGEISTPSRCGRLDQACAYNRTIKMAFDGDNVAINEINSSHPVYLVIVDLKSKKDTKKILADLSVGFPFPRGLMDQNKHLYLGKINKDLVARAEKALNNGDSETLGGLMTEAQREFDRYLAPCCREELTSPKLHKLLSYGPIQEYIFGGKGVGSQGDGSAQFVAKNREYQLKLIEFLNSDKLNVEALPLTIK